MATRRGFISTASRASIAAFTIPDFMSFYKPLIRSIGVNLFSLPLMLERDFVGTAKMLSNMGYKEIEMYGPYEFSTDAAKKNWENTSKAVGFKGSGFFGKNVNEIKSMLDDNGLTATSLHTDIDTISIKMGSLSEAANILGSSYVVLPAIPDARRKTLDDYKRVADLFNKIGAEAKANGIKFAYHNHGYGLVPMEGEVPLDLIFRETDPVLVFFEMDLYWTTAGGADPVKLLVSQSKRYRAMHIKDMKQKVRFSGDGGNSKQWIELWDYMTTAGDGILDLNTILHTAKANGVEHFFIEQDIVKQPEIALKKSIDYIKGLKA